MRKACTVLILVWVVIVGTCTDKIQEQLTGDWKESNGMQIVTFGPDSSTRWTSTVSQDTPVGIYTIGLHDSVHIMWDVGRAQTGTPISIKVSLRGD